MAMDFTQLANAVDANDTVDGSASLLLTQLTAMIADLKTQMVDPADQAKVQAFAERLTAAHGNLQLAITNNTPSQTPPTPIPDSSGTVSVDQQQAAQRAAQRSNPGGLGGTPRP